jgi:hypothetical protein
MILQDMEGYQYVGWRSGTWGKSPGRYEAE